MQMGAGGGLELLGRMPPAAEKDRITPGNIQIEDDIPRLLHMDHSHHQALHGGGIAILIPFGVQHHGAGIHHEADLRRTDQAQAGHPGGQQRLLRQRRDIPGKQHGRVPGGGDGGRPADGIGAVAGGGEILPAGHVQVLGKSLLHADAGGTAVQRRTGGCEEFRAGADFQAALPALHDSLKPQARLPELMLHGAHAPVMYQHADDVFATSQAGGDVVGVVGDMGLEILHRPAAQADTIDKQGVAGIGGDMQRRRFRRKIQREFPAEHLPDIAPGKGRGRPDEGGRLCDTHTVLVLSCRGDVPRTGGRRLYSHLTRKPKASQQAILPFAVHFLQCLDMSSVFIKYNSAFFEQYHHDLAKWQKMH